MLGSDSRQLELSVQDKGRKKAGSIEQHKVRKKYRLVEKIGLVK